LQTITPSDLTVSSAKIQTSAVTTAKIADANITAAKLDGAQSGSAPIYAARAWVNFNGTGTVAIRASGNVSSITDYGTGGYGVNFTTAMADINYTKNVSCSFFYSSAHSIVNTDVDLAGAESAPTTSSFRFICSTNVSGTGDAKYCSVAVFR
jgi:hypothetical protein